jgi:endonuclease YncB( thermonuclease family)
VEIDYEYIQIFKKPGQSRKVSKEAKAASRLTKEEWKEYFAGHWYFGGTRQVGHEAMFPEELPRRLIRMFSFQGDTVLDPFLGSGTTAKAAVDLGRNAVGYEINPDFLQAVPQKIGGGDRLPFYSEIQIIEPDKRIEELPQIDYTPAIRDAVGRLEESGLRAKSATLHKVTEIIDEHTVRLASGQKVRILGVHVDWQDEALKYLRTRILGKQVFLKEESRVDHGVIAAYIYLKNRILINAYLIKCGAASPDLSVNHKLRNKFIQLKMNADEAGLYQDLKPGKNQGPSG